MSTTTTTTTTTTKMNTKSSRRPSTSISTFSCLCIVLMVSVLVAWNSLLQSMSLTASSSSSSSSQRRQLRVLYNTNEGLSLPLLSSTENVDNPTTTNEAKIATTTTTTNNFALQNALTKIKARNSYLYTDTNTDTSQWGWKTGGTKKFHKIEDLSSSPQVLSLVLQPIYTCPYWTLHRTNYVSDTELTHVSGKSQFDGGKWTCGVKDIVVTPERPCVVYSFGSNNDDFFEEYSILQQNPKCQIHIFDPTIGKAPASWKDKSYYFFFSFAAFLPYLDLP